MEKNDLNEKYIRNISLRLNSSTPIDLLLKKGKFSLHKLNPHTIHIPSYQNPNNTYLHLHYHKDLPSRSHTKTWIPNVGTIIIS